MSKKIEGHPFGSQSSRFNLNGVHPNLLATGKMPYQENLDSQISKRLGPGSYELLKYDGFSFENVARSASGPNWEKGFLTEKYAKMPHLLYQETYKKKLEDKKKLGPAYYKINNGIGLDEKPRSNKGIIEQLGARFTDKHMSSYPGPGAYGIPDEVLEVKRKNKPGKVPLLERSKEPRSLPLVGSECPPGTYNHKNSIDELLQKRVSKRGPYDLFSLNRSGPTKTGHFIKDLDNKLGPGQYSLDSFVDLLNKNDHLHHGKLGTIAQYPNPIGDRITIFANSLQPRNPEWPGPGSYDPKEPAKFEYKIPPFLSSSERTDIKYQKRLNKNFNSVGVGRYDINKNQVGENGSAHKSVFLSKSAQILTKDKPFYAERIKERNLPLNEKLNLHYTGRIYDDISINV